MYVHRRKECGDVGNRVYVHHRNECGNAIQEEYVRHGNERGNDSNRVCVHHRNERGNDSQGVYVHHGNALGSDSNRVYVHHGNMEWQSRGVCTPHRKSGSGLELQNRSSAPIICWSRASCVGGDSGSVHTACCSSVRTPDDSALRVPACLHAGSYVVVMSVNI